MESVADADLVRRIASAAPGTDGDAEREVCRRFAPRVRLYGFRHLRDGAAADDLVQQVLVRVLEQLRAGSVREPERFASFVLGTCRMTAIEITRGERRRASLLEIFSADLVPEPEAAPSVDVDRLRRCLEALAQRERAVVVLTFFADRSADEIGAELGVLPGNVRVLRHRALSRLAECIEGAA
jgi:RNA polymerase sigma-70 factor (ECF subfamily)